MKIKLIKGNDLDTREIIKKAKAVKTKEEWESFREQYNRKLFFVIAEIGRGLTQDGQHYREIQLLNKIKWQDYYWELEAKNTNLLLTNDNEDGTSYASRRFKDISEAERWVKEKLKEIKDRLEKINEEQNKEKQYPAEEEIIITP